MTPGPAAEHTLGREESWWRAATRPLFETSLESVGPEQWVELPEQ